MENEDETFLAKDYSLMLLDARKPQDLRVVLDGVCIPSEDALSPEQSVIRGIVRDELVLQHSALCEKLLGLIGSKSEQAFRRFQAADLLSWLLQDSSNAFARFCNDYTLGNCITRLIKDAELEVSWAGMRLLRNISKYNMPFGMVRMGPCRNSRIIWAQSRSLPDRTYPSFEAATVVPAYLVCWLTCQMVLAQCALS